MAILMSCCCWDDVWKGSFASAIYTMIFYGLSGWIAIMNVVDDWDFLLGKRNKPRGETIIEKGDITKTHVVFNIITSMVSMGLVFSSILLIFGLKKKKRELFLPWIILMIGDLLIELSYMIYSIINRRVEFDPINGFIFTFTLFIVTLNIYSTICVISQYQVYKERSRLGSQQENITITFQTFPS